MFTLSGTWNIRSFQICYKGGELFRTKFQAVLFHNNTVLDCTRIAMISLRHNSKRKHGQLGNVTRVTRALDEGCGFSFLLSDFSFPFHVGGGLQRGMSMQKIFAKLLYEAVLFCGGYFVLASGICDSRTAFTSSHVSCLVSWSTFISCHFSFLVSTKS